MKKVILTLTVILSTLSLIKAQIQIGEITPQDKTVFIAFESQPFSQKIIIELPDSMHAPVEAQIDSMRVEGLSGLPDGITWQTSCGAETSCILMPLVRDSIVLSGIPTTAGTYSFTIDLTSYVILGGGLFPMAGGAFNYTIKVLPTSQKHDLITSYLSKSSSTSACDGLATIDVKKGTAPYSYKWDTNELTDTIKNKCLGNYNVTVTDSKGITDTLTIFIDTTASSTTTNPNPPFQNPCDTCTTGLTTYIATENELFVQDIPFAFDSIFYTFFNVKSIAILNVIGLPKGISWKTDCGINTKCTYPKWGNYILTLTGKSLEIGIDTITVTTIGYTADTSQNDFNGIYDRTFIISTFPQSNSHLLISSYSSDNVSSFGMCDGSAKVVASKGAAPYTYSWSTGSKSSSITGKCSDKYSIKVIDSKGLRDSVDLYISEPADNFQNPYFGGSAIDTVITNYDTCIVDYNLPIDSAFIESFTMIDSTHLSVDYAIYQGGKKIVFNSKFSFENVGVNNLTLQLNCKGTFTKMLKSTVISQSVNLQYNQIGTKQTVDHVTSIGKISKADKKVLIAPNPFSSQTTITISSDVKNASLHVMDVLGKVVKTIKFSGTQLVLEKGELTSGIYFVQIVTEAQVVAFEKIVIQ
jgi:hypothetical protein